MQRFLNHKFKLAFLNITKYVSKENSKWCMIGDKTHSMMEQLIGKLSHFIAKCQNGAKHIMQ